MVELDSILSTVNEMKGVLATLAADKGQKDGIVNADAIKKDELEKFKAEILAEFEKFNVKSKMPEQKNEEPKIKLADFMLMTKTNHPSLQKTAMSEGTAAQGGYAVPTEYTDMIFGALNNPSYVVNRFMPLIHNKGYKKELPKWLTDMIVYWIGEGVRKTASKPTLSNSESELKKICALIECTDEFIEDEITGMEGQLAKLVAQNMEIEFERLAFIGDVTGAGDSFNGVFHSTPNSANQGGGSIAFSDIVGLLNNANMLEVYRIGAEMFMNRTLVGSVMNIVDLAGRPIWNLTLGSDGKLQNTVLGIPITVCTAITNSCSTSGAKSVVFYGNPNTIIMGRKAGKESIDLLVSQHGVIDSEGVVTSNAYQMDKTFYRFVLRRSIVVPIGGAWTVIDEAA